MASPKQSSPRITSAQAKEALSRSGYLLESRLDTLLRNRGWYVDANNAYLDPDTGKSRELDLYAMSAEKAGPGEFDWVFGVVLIECINNLQPIAFITKDPQVGFLHHHEVKLAGIPVKIPVKGTRDDWEWLPDFLEMGKYHHYCKGRVATQFCSFVQKKSTREWMALHEDVHFDAFQKLCAATEYFVDTHFKAWAFNGHESVNIEIYYPLVVLQGELLEARPRGNSVKLGKVSRVQFRRSAIVSGEATDYQVDVVTEKYFLQYLQAVQREISKTARLMMRRKETVRMAIEKIRQRARRLRSPERIRTAMEF